MVWSRALETAIAAAKEAGDILRNDFHRPGGPRGKIDKAEADVEAENAIRARLSTAFPEWAYLGEETGRIGSAEGAPIWLVDPNDGTRDYLVGRRGSAVSIGLAHEGRPVLGVVYAFGYPDDDGDLFTWAEGCGPVQRNGVALEPRLETKLTPHSVVLVSSGGDRLPSVNLECAAPARIRTVASIAHRLALVGAGEVTAATSVHAPGAWDYAGGHALVRGAGGVLVDEAGREVTYAADGTSKVKRAFAASAPVAADLASRAWEKTLAHTLPDTDGYPIRLQRGAAVRDAARLARAQGCWLGQLAGDSLGSLVEFCSTAILEARYPDGPRLLADGGTWNTVAGQPTDDSEMALALARSIVTAGRYDPEAALAAYRAWYDSGPFDIGRTTRAALSGEPPPESEANGSLMRISPLAIASAGRPIAEAVENARRDAALTHPHPVCADATAAFVVAAAHAIHHGTGARPAYEAALAWSRASAVPEVTARLEAAGSEAPVCDEKNVGWVLIALQNAFYELLHAESLEAGVVATVRRGGDTDTNAAIAGALLGAVHGRRGIPDQWRLMVLSCRTQLGRVARPRPAVYWPADALDVAERLLLVAGR